MQQIIYRIFIMVHFTSLIFSSPVKISDGGTGLSAWPSTYAILLAGVTSQSNLQAAGATNSSGQVLTLTNPSMIPSFQNNNYGYTLLKTLTASSSATLTLTNTDFVSSYDVFIIELDNISPSTGTDFFLALFSSNNGSSYLTTGYISGINYLAYNSATITNTNSTTYIPLSIASSAYISGILYFYKNVPVVSPTTSPSFMNGFLAFGYPCNFGMLVGYCNVASGTVINNIQFKFSTGNIAQGRIKLYGLKVS